MATEHVWLKEDIRLDMKRCYSCGALWGIETFRSGGAECPLCAGNIRRSKNKEISKMERQIAGLKGALNRIKKGPK